MFPHTFFAVGTTLWLANVLAVPAVGSWLVMQKAGSQAEAERKRADQGIAICLCWLALATVAAYPTAVGLLIVSPASILHAVRQLV